MFAKEKAEKRIIDIAKKGLLPRWCKGECIAKLFEKTPREFHAEIILNLLISFHDYWEFSSNTRHVEIKCLVSAEDALLAKSSDKAKSFLKEVLAALWEDSLKGAGEVIFSYIHDENSSFALRAFIFEYVVTDFRKWVTSCPK